MKTVPFSLQLCQELLTRGYNYFVIQNEQDKNGFFNPLDALTFAPVRENPNSSTGVLIKKVMSLGSATNNYYILVEDSAGKEEL